MEKYIYNKMCVDRGAAKARKDLMAAATVAWGVGARPTVDWSQAHNVNSWRQYREVGALLPFIYRIALFTLHRAASMV